MLAAGFIRTTLWHGLVNGLIVQCIYFHTQAPKNMATHWRGIVIRRQISGAKVSGMLQHWTFTSLDGQVVRDLTSKHQGWGLKSLQSQVQYPKRLYWQLNFVVEASNVLNCSTVQYSSVQLIANENPHYIHWSNVRNKKKMIFPAHW